MCVAGALRLAEQVRTDGVNPFLTDGTVAGQKVSHVHLHVIPGVVDDAVTYAIKGATPGREALDEQAGEIPEHLWGDDLPTTLRMTDNTL